MRETVFHSGSFFKSIIEEEIRKRRPVSPRTILGLIQGSALVGLNPNELIPKKNNPKVKSKRDIRSYLGELGFARGELQFTKFTSRSR